VDCVERQIEGGKMSGFVKNFAAAKKVPPDKRGLVMGYYTAKHLPVYDHLARQYCVCDAWHSSVPGDTWPNRLYSLSGGEKDPARPKFLQTLANQFPALKALRNIPIYETEAFTRHLDEKQWRWYSHDPATLRAADKEYRKVADLKKDNFTWFDRKRVSFATEAGESLIVAHDSFLDDAAKGQLRDVSWIDPNFIDLSVLDPNSDDDHPPADVKAGQALVLQVYEALRRSPNWEDTLFVIVYDEHGGFHDHVKPPAVDDGGRHKTLGVRVPAIVVGPRVRKHVCHEVFDHTSLIKTVLTRFAKNADAAIASMGLRTANALHLGLLLEDKPRADLKEPAKPRREMNRWRIEAKERRQGAEEGGASRTSDGAGQDLKLHEFQEEFAGFVLALREGTTKLPPGQP
jgi:phospholipase C